MATVDNKVVGLDFDTSKFAAGVTSAIGSLQQLTSAFKVAENNRYLENMSYNLDSIGGALTEAGNRFSVFGIMGVEAARKICDILVDGVLSTLNKIGSAINSYSIDQIAVGWDKYGEKAQAVATIMAATGKDVEYVEDQMSKLNWFTDETSYNFTDMANNIGKFTANSIDLEDAVVEMQGIATWAALSGQGTAEASRAMYNLAQAIGVGSVKIMDWRSIENANMATAQFREEALKAAAAVGELSVSVDSAGKTIYKTSKGTEVTVETFRESLSEGWFSKAALEETLKVYGGFTTELNELFNLVNPTGGYITSQIVGKGGWLDQFEQGTLNITEIAKDCNMTVEDLTTRLESLTSEANSVGRAAFIAGQECRTFNMALEATKDAASTAWMGVWQVLFGNVEEAKVVWSEFCEWMYYVFVEPVYKIQDLMQRFVDSGGMKALKQGIGSLGEIINGLVEYVINKIDIDSLSDKLTNFAKNLYISMLKFKLVFKYLKENGSLDNLFAGFARFGNNVKMIFQSISEGISSAFGSTAPKVLSNKIADLSKKFYDLSVKLIPSEERLAKISNIFKALTLVAKNVANVLKDLASKIFPDIIGSGGSLVDVLLDAMNYLANGIISADSEGNINSVLGNIVNAIKNAVSSIIDFLKNLKDSRLWQDIKKVFGDVTEVISKAFGGLLDSLGKVSLGDILSASFKVGKVAIAASILKIGTAINYLVQMLKSLFGSLGIKPAGMTESFSVLSEALKSLGVGILVFAAAMYILSFIPTDKLIDLGMGLALFISGIWFLMTKLPAIEESTKSFADTFKNSISRISKAASLFVIGAAFVTFAASLIILAVALEAFTLIAKQGKDAWIGLGLMASAFAVILAIGAGVTIALDRLHVSALKFIGLAIGFAIITVALIALAVALEAFVLISKDPDCWKGLGLMAAAMATPLALILLFTLALTAMSPAMAAAGIGLMSIAAGLALFGLAAALAGAGLVLVGAGLAAIGIGILAIGTAIVGVFLEIVGGITLAVDILIGGIAAALEMVSGAVSQILQDIGEGIGGLIGGFFEKIGERIGLGISAIADGIANLGDATGIIGDNLSNLATSLQALKDVMGLGLATDILTLKDALNQLAQSKFDERVADAIDRLTNSMKNAGGNIVDNFCAGIAGASHRAYAAAANMGNQAVVGSRSQYNAMYNAGAYIALGLVNGMNSKYSSVYNAGYSLGKAAERGSKAATQEKSPSKVFKKIGEFVAMGFAIGINDNVGLGEKAGENLAQGTIDAAQGIIANMSDEINPVITPVLDLSQISKDADKLNDLMPDASLTTKLSGSIQSLNAVSLNANNTQPQVVTLDAKTLRELTKSANTQQPINATFKFEGSLAQLARVLQPELVEETERRGISFIR